MRPLLSLFSLASLLLSPMIAVAAVVMEGLGALLRGSPGHMHLMPGTPRSILETRRLGLA